MIISERIFYIMEQKNMSQLELSRRTGIATSNISDWKKKKTNPKADCLLSICDALDITPEQLLTGKGIDPEYKDADMDYEVTRSDIKILKQIHSLGDEQYKRLIEYTDFRKEYPTVKLSMKKTGGIFHDRFIVLDYGTADERVFLCGASSKDAGARITSIVEDYGTAKYNSVIAGLLKNSPLVLPK